MTHLRATVKKLQGHRNDHCKTYAIENLDCYETFEAFKH